LCLGGASLFPSVLLSEQGAEKWPMRIPPVAVLFMPSGQIMFDQVTLLKLVLLSGMQVFNRWRFFLRTA
jgi:hypothetical protein